MVGLEIDLKQIASAGMSISTTAGFQIVGGFVLGILVFWADGFPLGEGRRWDALYIAVAGAMSSTVIIVKVLYDRRELDTLGGRLTLGILVLQDLFAILFLAIQPSLDQLRPLVLIVSVVRVFGLIAIALLLSRFVLPQIFRRVARTPELVLVGSLAWCFGIGQLAEELRLSREMGALIAGVSISTFPYAMDITGKVTSLRDFFVTLFFVGLGLQMRAPSWNTVGLGFGIAAFVVLSRLVTTFTPLYLTRHGLRTSLLPSIYLCQISEFSLAVLALGAAKGHVSEFTHGAVALAFVFLAFASTMATTHSDGLVRMAIPILNRLGLKDLDQSKPVAGAPHLPPLKNSIVLLGLHRTGSSLLAALLSKWPNLVPRIRVVDFNPKVHAELQARGIEAIYGDISQRESLEHAGIPSASVIVCTIPDTLLKGTDNLRLTRMLRSLNPTAAILTVAESLPMVTELEAAGANYVSLARLDEAEKLAAAIQASEAGRLEEFRLQASERLCLAHEILP